MCKKPAFCFIFLLVGLGYGYSQSPSRIQNVYEKGDYTKTRDLIIKSLGKDSLNAGAKYYNSLLFMVDPFRSNTDSARWYINSAIADFKISDEDHLKDLEKAELTEEKLETQQLEVAERAFGESKAKSTVESMDYFLQYYPEAPQKGQAIAIRDSLAYKITQSVNTWQAYLEYMEQYPDSDFYDDSKTNYDRLLFEEKTGDNQLESFYHFLKNYPETPYRKIVEEWILKRTTIDHSWESYTAFLSRYPKSSLRKKIVGLLYYKVKEADYQRFDQLLALSGDTDSINQAKTLEWPSLFPVFSDGTYGFLNLSGQEVLPKEFISIAPQYYCGDIHAEWLQVRKEGHNADMIITRSGAEMLKGISSYTDLGSGVALVDFGSRKLLYHKSGFRIDEINYDEAQVINSQIIRTSINGLHGLLSMAGQKILDTEFNSIEQKGQFLLIKKGDKYAKTNISHLNKMVRDGSVELDFTFGDYDVVNDSLLITFNGDKEALYDANLQQLIPEGNHQIFTYGAAWYVKKEDGFQIYNRTSEAFFNQTFPYLEVNNGWMAIKKENEWLLISQLYKVLPMKALDSVKLISDNVAYIKEGDTLKLIFNNGKEVWLQPDEQVVLFRSGDQSQEYIKIKSDTYHKVLSTEGIILMDGKFEELSYLTDSLLVFHKKGKKGIISVKGKEILGPKYDGINEKNGLISLLEDGKIGCYNPETGVKIAPKYESIITPFGDYFIVTKDQKVGLIDKESKEIIPIEYDEFKTWNDTSCWARASAEWKILSFNKEMITTGIKQIELIGQIGSELFYKILKDQVYGVMSSVNGDILQPGYNDIVNLGTEGQPLFFAEQHLQAADFFIVTYLDKKGAPIRSQAYRPNEYGKIYCDR